MYYKWNQKKNITSRSRSKKKIKKSITSRPKKIKKRIISKDLRNKLDGTLSADLLKYEKKYEELLKNLISDLKSLSEKYQAQTEKKEETIDYESIVKSTPKLLDNIRYAYSTSLVEKDICIKPSFYTLETTIETTNYGMPIIKHFYKITGYFYYEKKDEKEEDVNKIKEYLSNKINEKFKDLPHMKDSLESNINSINQLKHPNLIELGSLKVTEKEITFFTRGIMPPGSGKQMLKIYLDNLPSEEKTVISIQSMDHPVFEQFYVKLGFIYKNGKATCPADTLRDNLKDINIEVPIIRQTKNI